MKKTPTTKKKICLAAAICLVLEAPGAFAEALPDAGKILETTKTKEITAPVDKAPNVTIHKETPEEDRKGGPKVMVRHYRFTGQPEGLEKEIYNLTAENLGKELTLSELKAVAAKVTKALRARGLMVAKAVIPVQEIEDDTVLIEIIPGRYGSILVRNNSSLKTSYITDRLKPLKEGSFIRQNELERVLLLLNETEGVKVNSSIQAGEKTGFSSLIIEVRDDKKVSGQLSVDNWGNRFTGEWRSNLSIAAANLTRMGDKVSISGLYAGNGLKNYQLAYSLPTGYHGGKLGISIGQTDYVLGESYTPLGASGRARVVSLYENYPLLRSRALNVYGQIGFEIKKLQDEIGTRNIDNQKKSTSLSIGLSGNQKDGDGNGITGFDVSVSKGRLTMESEDAANNDDDKTAGDYTKASLNLVRQKYITPRLSYLLSVSGQLTSKNLDSSEKLSLGGANGVRAYPAGEAAGDVGYLATGELRWNMPTPSLQLAAFIDTGRVALNKGGQLDGSSNTRLLTGAGLGIILSRAGDYTLRCDYAWKITSGEATSDADKHGRLWVRGVKTF